MRIPGNKATTSIVALLMPTRAGHQITHNYTLSLSLSLSRFLCQWKSIFSFLSSPLSLYQQHLPIPPLLPPSTAAIMAIHNATSHQKSRIRRCGRVSKTQKIKKITWWVDIIVIFWGVSFWWFFKQCIMVRKLNQRRTCGILFWMWRIWLEGTVGGLWFWL